jgi:hypothetical protein
MGLAVGIDDGVWRKARNKCCLDLFGVFHPSATELLTLLSYQSTHTKHTKKTKRQTHGYAFVEQKVSQVSRMHCLSNSLE